MPPLEKVQAALADRYTVEREIGRGGMATVYLAQDRKHDRQVAVKVLHPELAASLGPERFLREIKVAARLSHPHIVSLHDSGQAGDFLYYVMPYIEGESLRQRLTREQQLQVEDALEITRHVASALGYAHGIGVVHRDIKPENVMLHQGEAVVTDFGIAKAVTSAAGEHLTQTGSSPHAPARSRSRAKARTSARSAASCRWITVLEGSVRKAGNRLRITAQLLKVTDGYQLWSERYDRELEDVFAIQDEIAQNIARALRVVMTDKEIQAIVKPQTADVEAYDYYLRGRGFFHQWRKKSLVFARQMFTRAIEIDAGYALAFAGIADCCSSLYTWFDANEAYREEAERTSLKALELNPDLAEAHEARGVALTVGKRWDEAQREFEIAIRLSPKLFEAYYFYGRLCFLQGKLADAARWFAEAARVRPEDYQALSLLGTIYADLDRPEDALVAFRRSLQVVEKHVEMYPDDARAFYMGALDAIALGRPDQAETWVERALEIDPEDPLILYNVGCVYARLGKTEAALDCLEQTVAHGGSGHRGWMRNDGDLASLRGHPRFETMLQEG